MSARIPEGYMRNSRGGFDPESMVKDVDKLRDQTVRAMVAKAEEASSALSAFKADAMADVAAFVDMSSEQYGVRVGGTKGNVTLTTYDGELKVVRAISEQIVFDERIQAAKALIDACIHEWGASARPEIMTLVNDAFQVDKQGNISTGRILGLRRLNITDDKWKQAMQAIADSMKVSDSKSYIRFYRRDAAGGYAPIPLDVSNA